MAYGTSRIDLHMHSVFSDGTDTPREIIEHVRNAGLDLFSVTDHDALRAAREIPPLLDEDSPAFVTGIEFSCKDEKGKYHILGYGFDPYSDSMTDIVGRSHDMRIEKMRLRVEFLKEKFGFTFSGDDIKKLFELDNPGKPHLGILMVEYGYAPSKSEAITKYINLMKTGSVHVLPDDAIDSIRRGGGIPVLAHPFFGSGEEEIFGDEMTERLERLISYGLQGIEAYYSSFTDDMTKDALSLAEKYGLFVTAGSDYHGKNKPVLLADTGLSPEETEYPDGLKKFIERVTK